MGVFQQSAIMFTTLMSGEPQIEVEQAECGTSNNPAQWLFKWRVRNVTATPMNLLSVRVPHGKFKADERTLGPAAKIAAQGSLTLDLIVACQEPPNTIIENAFLILLVHWQENQWRFFVRLRIMIDHRGHPGTTTESITVQQVGFSGVSN
jgi:hypothetical protein